MRKIVLDRFQIIVIFLLISIIVWIFLLSQYTDYIENLIGPIGIMMIFLILLFPLIYCSYIYNGGESLIKIPYRFKIWKTKSKKRKTYDIIFFLIVIFDLIIIYYIDFVIFKHPGRYSLGFFIVFLPLVIIYFYFRPSK